MLNQIKILFLMVTLGMVQSEKQSVSSFNSVEVNSDGCLKVQNDGDHLPKSQINLSKNVECQVADSNEVGTMKFLFECLTLNKSATNLVLGTSKLCNYEICSDLVCCPATTESQRLKNICWDVDDPRPVLAARFYAHHACTVRELNLTGFYQQKCMFADRYPHLRRILQNSCNEIFLSDNWYCCPIEPNDAVFCKVDKINRKSATLVGPKCIDSNSGRVGRCKRVYPNENRIFLNLDFCGKHCNKSYYCFPDPDTDTYASPPISTRECTSYTKYLYREEIEVTMENYNNTVISMAPFAAGGVKASPGKFPHMAALGYEQNKKIEWNCGGSLISDRYVITAAHCLTRAVKKVRLGVTNLLNDLNTKDCPEDFDVARVIPHPDYISQYVYNDIGMIELVEQVNFNVHIRPICLASRSDLPTSFLSMGWGALGPFEDKTLELIQIDQELFTYEECQEYYNNNMNHRGNRGILNETQICAGSKYSIQSTCAGDSGGPLIANHDIHRDLFYIYGVVSFGTVCGFADTPGVYTKVFPYIKWIEGIVWSN